MKQPIRKKEFLSEEKKEERKRQERVERQNEILKNRSEGLQKWTNEHTSAKLIYDNVMNALDYTPKEYKKAIALFLRLPLFEFNYNHTDYQVNKNDIGNLDAIYEMFREVHDILAKEVGLENYKEHYINHIKEIKKRRAIRRRSVKKEEIEPYEFKASDENEGLPF